MSKYSEWIKNNILNPNKDHYDKWLDEDTFVRGVYDKETGKGIERKYILSNEYEVDKTDEINEDRRKYQE